MSCALEEKTLTGRLRCQCGHVLKEYWNWGDSHFGQPCPGSGKCIDADLPFGHSQIVASIVERPCPHAGQEMGTTILEYCPNCDAVVGLWGYGPAGSVECACMGGRESTTTYEELER